ncbi:MAG: S1 RNA-binding domain-containing protein, partial [Candidatus Eisenbacteria bacterium]
METETLPPGEPGPDKTLPSDASSAEAPVEPIAEEEAPSTEFEEALTAHERSGPAAEQAIAAKNEMRVGQKVHAKVVSIGDPHAILDFGGRSEAVAEIRHFQDEAGTLKIAIGDELDLFVIEGGDPVTLGPALKTKGGAALQKLRDARDAGVPITGRVTAVNAGGLSVELGGVRGFCPMSQIELGFCSDPKIYVGKSLEFLVTEVKDGRGGAVVSRRQLLRRGESEKGKVLLATLEPGAELEGTIERLEAFGAFVDLGGVDGLVHVSEIAHERIGHPSHALKKGDKVRVRVLKLEAGKEGKPRIALSIKAATPDPWQGIEAHFAPGQRVTGTVARLTDFGAFVALAPGIDGLVHVSEAAAHRVGHVKEVLTPGQTIEAVVRTVEPEKRRISLSIREAMGVAPAARRAPQPGEATEGVVAGIKPFGVFVDLPDYGSRVTGMIPHEESGQLRGADLATVFTMGQKVRVEVLEPRQGKVRLRLEGATPRPDDRAGSPAAGPRGEGG